MSYVPPQGPPSGPPQGPPTGPVYAAPPPDDRQSRQMALVIVGGVIAVLLIVLAVVVVTKKGSDDDAVVAVTETTAPAAAGEVFLAAADDPGVDPFGASVAAAMPPSTVPLGKAVVLGSSGVSAPALGAPTGGGLKAYRGGTPGLYGGTRDSKSCDAEQMISYLTDNPSKGAAWAAAAGISQSDLPAFIRSLTPVLLRGDTRVTNFGYKDGRATPHQAILQAGTAVLVDQYGVPRAKCNCGNPLGLPVAISVAPHYTGPQWPGFTPTGVTVIEKNTTIIKVITLIDVVTGTPFGRPTGPQPGPDTGLPSVTTAPPATSPLTQPPRTTLPTQGSTFPPATSPPATYPPGTNPPGTQPPATRPPATQPPATQPPVTVDNRPFRLVSATHTVAELVEFWTVDDRAGTAVIDLKGTGRGLYTWSVPQEIPVNGVSIDWGGKTDPLGSNISITISPRAAGATFSTTDLDVATNQEQRKSAVLTPTADAQEITLSYGMGFSVGAVYVYRRG